MVAVIEKVEHLGRRSGLVTALCGLFLVLIIIVGNSDVFEDGPAQWMRRFHSWRIGNWMTLILPPVMVLSTAYATGLLVGKYVLRGFLIGLVWATIAAYLDLIVMLLAFEIGRFLFTGGESVLQFMSMDEYAIILLFTVIYASLPILVAALLRTLWLRKRLGHERVLW